jgi:uncharacterized membrane protein
LAHGDDQANSEGDVSRSVRGSDGRSDSAHSNAEHPVRDDGKQVDSAGASEHDPQEQRESGAFDEELLEVERSFSGPLPPAGMLHDYEMVVTGSAQGIVDAHLYGERARADALTRITKAEAKSVTTGAIGAQVLTIGGLGSAVVLILLGYEAGLIAIIPGVLGAAAQVVSAARSK